MAAIVQPPPLSLHLTQVFSPNEASLSILVLWLSQPQPFGPELAIRTGIFWASQWTQSLAQTWQSLLRGMQDGQWRREWTVTEEVAWCVPGWYLADHCWGGTSQLLSFGVWRRKMYLCDKGPAIFRSCLLGFWLWLAKEDVDSTLGSSQATLEAEIGLFYRWTRRGISQFPVLAACGLSLGWVFVGEERPQSWLGDEAP